MIKHILKIIWAQRRGNFWIFTELLLVVGAFWLMLDTLWVEGRTYYSPLGYDITNTWRLKLSLLNPGAPNYVSDEVYNSDQAQDLRQLLSRIKQHPAIEEACVTYYSHHYSYGNSWSQVIPVEGDTSAVGERSFQLRRVSPEYFDVFRVKDVSGNSIRPMLEGRHNPTVISIDMEKLFFPGLSAVGRQIGYKDSDETFTVSAISTPIRAGEYSRSEPCFYKLLVGSVLDEYVELFGVNNAELCVRMKQSFSWDDMNKLLEEMGERLTVNNLYVYGVRSIDSFRAESLKTAEDKSSKQLSLMTFLLINVLFGIVGTFWLRTQHRQGEMGLRIALGASRMKISQFMYVEGLCILMLTIPLVLFFAANMIYMDRLDTYRIPLSVGRFLITFGGAYLLMAGMICLGIWFPVRKAARMAPAEALHYE